MSIIPFALAGLGCALMTNPPRRRRRRRATRSNPRGPWRVAHAEPVVHTERGWHIRSFRDGIAARGEPSGGVYKLSKPYASRDAAWSAWYDQSQSERSNPPSSIAEFLRLQRVAMRWHDVAFFGRTKRIRDRGWKMRDRFARLMMRVHDKLSAADQAKASAAQSANRVHGSTHGSGARLAVTKAQARKLGIRMNPRRRGRRNPGGMTPEAFVAEARRTGCIIEAGDSIITLTKRFEPGSKAGYTDAEGATSLVYSAPGKGGSVWGTDGGSIGGYVGLKGGYCTLNKSGVQKRWLAKVAALVGRSNPRRRRRRK